MWLFFLVEKARVRVSFPCRSTVMGCWTVPFCVLCFKRSRFVHCRFKANPNGYGLPTDHSGLCCLRRVLSSTASTMRSWVRIPRRTWMYVCCFFSVFALSCVDRRLAMEISHPTIPAICLERRIRKPCTDVVCSDIQKEEGYGFSGKRVTVVW